MSDKLMRGIGDAVRLASSIAAGVFAYLMCAFVAWDINAGNWGFDGRFAAAMLIPFFVGATFTAPIWWDRNDSLRRPIRRQEEPRE